MSDVSDVSVMVPRVTAVEADERSRSASHFTPDVWCEYAPAGDGEFHTHNHVVVAHKLVLWLADGPGLHLHRGRRVFAYRPRAGRLDFMPPCTFDAVHASGPMPALLVFINERWARHLAAVRQDEERGTEFQFNDPRLRAIALHMHQSASGGASFGSTFVAFLAQALLARLQERDGIQAAHHDGAGKMSSPTQRILREYIEHALGSAISVEQMATLVGYGTVNFMRDFRATFGIPPHQYLLSRRIARARSLLQGPAASLTDIALSVGFSSLAHFSAAFHKTTGQTPSHYRHT